MAKEWVVIANREQAKIFLNEENPGTLKFIRSLPNDFNVPKKYAFRHDEVTEEHTAREFVNELAEMLKKDKEEKMFERLLICAEPHFMGKLKAAINGWAKNTPISWLNRDLIHLPTDQLEKHVKAEELRENPVLSL